MDIIDISWPISPDMTGYKNAVACEFEPLATFEKNSARTTCMMLTSHTGTHVDAPSHFIQKGAPIDAVDLRSLCGPCIVLDATQCKEAIDIAFLTQAVGQIDLVNMIVVFKTKNSQHTPTGSFDPEFVYISQQAATWLVQAGIKAVGIDYLGIERGQVGHPTHLQFLEQNISIIEGLRLGDVHPDRYTLICLPLNIVGLDGAPARAVLIPLHSI